MLFRLLITIEFFRVTGFVSVLANNNNNDVIIDDNPYCRSNNQSFPRNPFHQTNNPASIASSRSKVEMFGEILKARAQELRRTPNRKVELVFLVDASASVGAEEFLNELKFVKKLLADFTVDRHSTRVSVITFSSKSRIIRHIDHLSHPRDDNHKCSLMEEELPKIEFSGGGTYTLGAVLEAQNVFKSARPDAKKALFLITDGYSNSGDPRPAAEKLKEDNVEIFTFGIRQGNFRELCDMASESKEQHTYILDSFDEFEALARRALHEDLHVGNYIIQNSTKCDSLCDEKRDCCDFLSTCRCGTHTGKYECVCQAGYYGNGLKNGCIACPEGTYKNYTGPGDKSTCIPCPDPSHTSPPGSISVHQCQCRRGYRPIEPHACAAKTCPELTVPENGLFVQGQCSNDVNAACGISCKSGYKLLGSSLRLCTEEGVWTGTDVSCEVKRCPQLHAPANGNMVCTKQDFSFETHCHFQCNPGYKLVGSKSQSCLAFAGWTGIPPKCREVKCPELKNVADGKLTPETCATKESSFGTLCTYVCRKGYKLHGPHSKQCMENGKWNPTEEEISCIDVQPPVITCPHNIQIYALNDENIGNAWWEIPTAIDNSGFLPTVTVIPALLPPVSVPIGENTIVYTAEDGNRNKARCSFNITVIDVQPPRVDKCISPPTFTRKSNDIQISWEEPIFSDNSRAPVNVTQSHKPGIFPLGTTMVTYVAADKFNNTSTCVIEITVQAHACANHIVPLNGHLDCTSHPNGVECIPSCDDGFKFAIQPSDKYFCDYNDGSWNPTSKWPIRDCSVSKKSNHVKQSSEIQFKLKMPCKDRLILNQLDSNLEKKIQQKVFDYCLPHMNCSLERFETKCMDEDAAWKSNEIETNNIYDNFLPDVHRRRRRSVHRSPVGARFAKDGVTDAKSTVVARYDVTGFSNLSTHQDEIRQGVASIMDRIRQDAYNWEFNQIFKDEDFTVVGLDYTEREPEYLCQFGSVLIDLQCVKCPGGTFFNVVNEACEGCLKGTYQPEEGQLTCLVCPSNTSTADGNSRSIQQCKGQCLPGSFSYDGLEWCETCPIGFYQPNYAQSHCLQCPEGTTTWRRGNRRLADCGIMCQQGYVSKTGLEPCFPCPRGYFQPEQGKSSCFLCPDSVKTRDPGSTDITDCEGISVSAASYSSIPTTELVINECFATPCQNGGSCVNLTAGFTCQCLSGWKGLHCEIEIDECQSNPCQNNGTCLDELDSFNCSCTDGYEGTSCEINIDDCLSGPCQNNATCVDLINNYSCECLEGFNGSSCETNIDDCLDSNCKNGTCVDGIAEYKCQCFLGYQGDNCEIDIDECLSMPCVNNGTCFNYVNSYSCLCKLGYAGTNCEYDIDECASSPCINNGTCLNLEGLYVCKCPPSYSGSNCETKLNSSYDLEFPSSGITDYLVIEDPFGDRNLTAVTISMWMKTNDKNNQGTPVSYATDTYDNALVITDYTGFVIYVNGHGKVTDTTANDNRWHHIVMTWSGELGSWKICKDGEIIEAGVGMMENTTIEGGGVLVVGQEQDSRGGKFSSAESYVGKISKLNIWDRELTMDEIQSQSTNCDEVIGNLVAWPDFLAGLNGRVGYMDTQLCKGCSPPENLTDGEATWTDTKLNSSVHYSCKPGFDLTGPDVRFCQSDTTWSGSEPKCERKSCGHPGAISNGYLATTFVLYGNTAIYKCSPGYRMDGNHTLYCNASGLWEGRLGTCKEIICPTPVLPPNMRFTTNRMSDYKPGEVARFTCNPGYRLVGPRNSSKCNPAGIWDNALPACEEVRCSAPPNITNGRPVVKPDEIFTANHSVIYKCNPGFAIFGSVDRIVCFHPGVWSVKIPICQEVRCRPPPGITNGFVVGSNYTQGNVVKYQCYNGYLIKGHADVLLCMESGVWNGTAPSCERVKCRRPDPLGNGSVDVVDNPTYSAVARYRCNTGYILIGNSERKCLMTSAWSGTPPSCDPVGCAPPGEIPHGKVTGAAYFLGNVIEYSCDEGYSLDGVEQRTCGPYGLWSMSEPSCLPIKCPVPENLLHGHIVGSNYFYKGVIEFACISGYRLNGVAKQECTASADWSDDHPVCEKVLCQDPVEVEHGYFDKLPLYESGSVVEYHCHTGYEIQGKNTRICLEDGTWSGPMPECISIHCELPDDIEHGRLVSNATEFGSTLEYQCDQGYELTGPSNRTCSDGKQWIGTDPICVEAVCPSPPSIINSVIIGKDHQVGATILYKCNIGYELKGPSKSHCLSSKEWSVGASRCVAVECDKPSGLISNGRMVGSSFSYGSRIHYVCDEGYFIDGSPTRYCQADGRWLNPVPLCERVACPHPTRPPNSDVAGYDYRFKEKITYECKTGYRLVGSAIRTCQSDKTWSGSTPHCVEIDCGHPSDISHGKVLVQGYLYKNVAQYQCNRGYWLDGNKKRECGSNGTWIGAEPRCVEVECGKPPVVENAKLLNDQPIVAGLTVEYQCEQGYSLAQSDKLACTSFGNFTGDTPKCIKVECPKPEEIPNGHVEAANNIPGSVLRYSCDSGFDLVGDAELTCGNDGSWSGSLPSCVRITCLAPDYVPHAIVKSEGNEFGATVSYICNDGYKLDSGNLTRTCLRGKTWSGDPPFCKKVACPPPDIQYGYVANTEGDKVIEKHVRDIDRFVYGITVEFECEEGFYIKGLRLINCLSNGSWSGSLPSCERVQCPELNISNSVIISPKGFAYGFRTLISCKEGFELIGVMEMNCLSSGNWSTGIPRCEPIQCQEPPHLEHVEVEIIQSVHIGAGYPFRTTLNFKCNIGYEMVGAKKLTCLGSKTWSGAFPNCKPIACSLPLIEGESVPLIKNQKNDYYFGDIVVFQCSPGHRLIGSSEIACNQNKTWNGTVPHCEQLSCEKPEIENAVLKSIESTDGVRYTFGTTLVIECKEGFVLEGASQIECLESQRWSNVFPKCVPVTCSAIALSQGSVVSSVDGAVIVANVTAGEHVKFECDEGFKITGESSAECLPSGKWSLKSIPECIAVTCPMISVEGGEVRKKAKRVGVSEKTLADAMYGDVVRVSCMDGYSMLSGDVFELTCTASGNWSDDIPVCELVLCPEPFVENASVVVVGSTDQASIFTFGTLIQFNCDKGFRLIGESDNLCQPDSAWSEPLPRCDVVHCSPLSVANATLNTTATVFGTKVKVTCFIGFEMFGSEELECQAQGRWSGLIPICLKVACAVPVIPYARFKSLGQVSNSFSFGDGLSIECEEGFELVGQSKIICNENKKWGPVIPSCKLLYCPDLELNVTNLKHIMKKNHGQDAPDGFPFDTEILFECDLGYVLEGKSSIRCQSNSSWSSEIPQCRRVLCQEPFLDNGNFTPNVANSLYTFGSNVIFSCHHGFRIIGEGELYCQPNGEWTSDFPTCIRLSCPDIPKIFDGTFIGHSKEFESTVRYICDDGYELAGSENITCLENQQWSEVPSCLPIKCPIPDEVVHGEYMTTGFTYESILRYTCHRGYELHGQVDHTCMKDGNWSGELPTCKPVNCSQPPYLPHADLIGDSYMFGDSLTVECHEGYVLDGIGAVDCQWNKTWSRVLATCKIVACGEPFKVAFARVDGNRREFNSSIQFICNRGFQQSGELVSTCLSNGLWSPVGGQCLPVVCRTPILGDRQILIVNEQEIRNTSEIVKYRPDGFFYRDRVTYVCDEGYELLGFAELMCTVDGLWNSTAPKCEPIECPRPPRLLHVSYNEIISQKYTYGYSISVSCSTGYSLKSAGVIQCQASRSWNVSEILCEKISCPKPDYFANGGIRGNDYTYGARILHRCLEGYVLVGDKQRVCGIDGNWSGVAPICSLVNCPKIDHFQDGFVEGSNYSYQAVLVFHCIEGYHLNGESKRTCQADGQWSGYPALCSIKSCNKLHDISYGRVLANATTFGSVAEYKCDVGYELLGENSRTCDANGYWTGHAPDCRQIVCIDPPTLENGFHTGSVYNFGSTIEYACNNKYALIGPKSSICQANRTWSGRVPTCRLKLCPQPPKLLHMHYQGDDFSHGSVVEFTCDLGYVIIGKRSLTCLDSENWSGNFPTCERKSCSSPPLVPNAIISNKLFVYEDVYRYQCLAGYQLNGQPKIVCQSNGQWSNSSASCKPVWCGEPPFVEKARTIQNNGLHFGDLVYYICEEGYDLNGNNLIECSAAGKWIGDLPKCEMVTCGIVPVISHASTIVHRTTYGSKATYECNRGYVLSGSSFVECRANGTWSYKDRPTCEIIKCGQPPAIPGGGVLVPDVVYGSMATYYCLEGYRISGNPIRHCGDDGSWNGSGPNCTLVTCIMPDLVMNGKFIGDDFSFGHEVLYSCKEGYRVVGDEIRTCQPDGSWSGRPPSCQLVYCQTPDSPENGFVNFTGLHYGSVARYWCSEDYLLEGNDSVTCYQTGNWSSSPPFCIPAPIVTREAPRRCGPPPSVKNAQNISQEFVAGDSVQFTCAAGYTSTVPVVTTCQDDLTWTGPHGQCERVDCGRPTHDPTIRIHGFNFKYGDRVAYTCRPGLSAAVNPAILTCMADGRWNGIPECKANCKFECQNGGTCVGPNKCKCREGFAGRFCETAICKLPCLNGGRCVGNYKCDCPYGYSGERCQTVVCVRPCQNGGRCVLANRCSCPHGFVPPFCESSRIQLRS